jgi:hypothetical protein
MNPDIEDPNNHVPAVTPDDDWDVLEVEQVFDAQLPPRRAEAPKIPKMDVNLSGLKVIDPAHALKTAAALDEDVSPKSEVSVNTYGERVDTSEKEEFQPGLALEDMILGDSAEPVRQRPIIPSRFNVGERDDWGAAQKKGSARWMLYTALGIILLVVLTVSLSYLNREDPKEVLGKKKSNQLVTDVDDKDFGQSALGRLTKGKQEAMRIYAQYVKAKSIGDIGELIYLSDRNAPLISKIWKPSGAEEGWKPGDRSLWKTYQNESLLFGELRGTNYDFSTFLAVYRYENEVLKMDWKATSGYGSANFEELKLGQGDGSEIRAWIESSSFYTQELPENRYRSFIVRSPKKDVSIWVYTEIGSEIDNKVVGLFSVSPITGEYKTECKVILSLDRGKGAILPQQWMIKDLIAENWLDQAKP